MKAISVPIYYTLRKDAVTGDSNSEAFSMSVLRRSGQKKEKGKELGAMTRFSEL